MDRDLVVLAIYEQLLELEQRLIPVGLHVFGQAPDERQLADTLFAVAAFDRPEVRIRSLPNLIAEALGLPDYPSLVADSAGSAERVEQRQRIEAAARDAVVALLTSGTDAAIEWLRRETGVSRDAAFPTLAFLDRIRQDAIRGGEMEGLLRGLRAEYIEPGPGADVVQNPSVLPTGRNTHAVNPYAIPSQTAFLKAGPTVDALLQRHIRERGGFPEAIGMVLWGMDNIKTQGEGVAQALWLMGAAPERDSLNRATAISVIPLQRLGRPRIDVVMTVSGIFRDLFGPTVEMLDRAARAIASLDEPRESNFLRKHLQERTAAGETVEDAATRVFSNSPGNYGSNVNFMVGDSQWQDPNELGDLFVTRKCFAYGRAHGGREARRLLDTALGRVEATYQNIDNAEIGITDVDHYFEYLGGLTQAVEKRAGRKPSVYLSDAVSPVLRIRSLEEAIRLETRVKTLNPKWYEGLLRHGFQGVAQVEQHVSNTFGWSATAGAVETWVYDEIAATYLLDENMLERLRSANPDATRGLAARLLEARERGFWSPADEVGERLNGIVDRLDDELEGVEVRP
jgi:magnesium chelatase subunit H